jgi:two-component system sensor histidine kinase BaeS
MPERAAPSLGVRIALASVVVAIAAVAALALVMVLATRSETGRLSEQGREQTTAQVAAELARAYRAAGSWPAADPAAALALARRADAVAVVRDGQRSIVATDRPGAGMQRGSGQGAMTLTRPIVVDGERVGTVELRFRGTPTAAQALLRDDLGRAVLLGSALAVRDRARGRRAGDAQDRATLRRLAGAASRLRAGDLQARAADPSAPGELSELSRAFDRMAETLARQERSRHRLVTDLAHEIRTPITILQGNLEELIDAGEAATTERLASLHEEVLRLGRLVEQLDALARAQTPTAALDLTSMDVGALAAGQLDALSTQIAAKQLTVRPRLSSVTVRADRARLGQVLANLLANAAEVHARRWAHRRHRGRCGRRSPRRGRGHGPGRAPERARARIRSLLAQRGGCGRVRAGGSASPWFADIVEAHGGRVEVTDNHGAGTRFIVALPFG